MYSENGRQSCCWEQCLPYQTDETVEREAIVHLLLNLNVTQSIPCMQKYGLEQDQAVITRTTCGFMALGIGDCNNTSYGNPVDYPVYLEVKVCLALR